MTFSRKLRCTLIQSTLANTRGKTCGLRLHQQIMTCCSPEAVLVLRSVSTFESLYLSRSTTRMNEAVSTALNQYFSARGSPPGAGEGVTIARTVTNELDSARFDPLLVRTVARNGGKVLEGFVSKIDGMAGQILVPSFILIVRTARTRLHRDIAHWSEREPSTDFECTAYKLSLPLLLQPTLCADGISTKSMGYPQAYYRRESRSCSSATLNVPKYIVNRKLLQADHSLP